MKAHGRFLIQYKGKLVDMLGSDSYVRLDGRLALKNQIQAMIDRAKQLKNVKPTICGFKIYKGEISYRETEVIAYKDLT